MTTGFAAMLVPLLLADLALGAAEIKVPMDLIDDAGVGKSIGTVTLADTPAGLRLNTDLTGLPPGQHGFHVHEVGNCGAAEKDGKMIPGEAAGGHLDPAKSGQHLGPEGKGHLGDLPVLTVASDGTARESVVAPRLKVNELHGRSLIIHAGGDNYSDQPKPLGGGGARLACGVVP
jgi:Cu-Zn family superoxide dismutase